MNLYRANIEREDAFGPFLLKVYDKILVDLLSLFVSVFSLNMD